MPGVRYGSAASVEVTRAIMTAIRDTAYRASIDIAQEKGSFPGFDNIRHGASPFGLQFPHDIRFGVARARKRMQRCSEPSRQLWMDLPRNARTGKGAPRLTQVKHKRITPVHTLRSADGHG